MEVYGISGFMEVEEGRREFAEFSAKTTQQTRCVCEGAMVFRWHTKVTRSTGWHTYTHNPHLHAPQHARSLHTKPTLFLSHTGGGLPVGHVPPMDVVLN
jgi:hypothetical protein